MEWQMIRLIWVVIAVGFGTGYQIYSTSVVNNVGDIVKAWINETYYHRHSKVLTEPELNVFWSAIVACVTVGACFGAMTLFAVADKLGRRLGLIFAATFAAAGSVIAAFSKLAASYEMLFIGRFLVGYSLGVGMGVASMFLTEIPPIKYRGACGAVIGLFIGLGDLTAMGFTLPEIFGTETLWPIAFALPAIPAMIEIVTLLFCKESPRFLYLTKENTISAEESLKFYQGTDWHETNLDLANESKAAKKEPRNNVRFSNFLCNSKYRKQLLIVAALNTASSFSGIDSIMAYSTSMLEDAGLSVTNAKYASAGIGACNFVMPFITILTVERLGRRFVCLGGEAGCLLFIVILTLLTGLKTHAGIEGHGLSHASVAAIVSYTVFFGIQQSIVVFLTSEIFEQDVRGMGMTVANVIFFGLGALQDIAYSPFEEAVGVTYSYLPFIASTTVCLTFLALELPETKGRSIDEIIAVIRNCKTAVAPTTIAI